VTPERFSDFPADAAVQEQVALLMAARARQEAIKFADRGDFGRAQQSLRSIRVNMESLPMSPQMAEERAALEDLEADFTLGNSSSARKKALSQSFSLRRSRGSNPRRSMKSE